MPAKKATKRKSKKAPSPAQLRVRKAFASAAKARAKATKGKKRASKNPVDYFVVKEISKNVWKWGVSSRLNKGSWTWSIKSFKSRNKAIDAGKRETGLEYGGERNPAKRARNKTIIKAGRIDHLDVSKIHNPGKSTRRKYRNGYLDLVIMGHAKKTPDGWSLGGKTFKQGKGIVPASRRGYYLDKATGTVFSKKARNISKKRNLDHRDAAHPIEVSRYWQGRKGYLTPWQRAHKAGQQGLFEHGIKTRNPKAKGYARFKVDFFNPLYVFVVMEDDMTIAQARKDAYSALEMDLGKFTHNGYRIIGEGELVTKLPTNAGPVKGSKRVGKGGKTWYWAYISRRDQRNPSVKQIRKTFAGTVGKTQGVFAPIGTPKNVAKLGKLLLIDTEGAVIKPSGMVYLCADAKGKLHLCGSKNVPIYSGPAQSFGQIKRIEYETAKPHLYPGQGVIQFWHKMGEESGNRPTLYADGKGGLKFRGGSYRITREGIVD